MRPISETQTVNYFGHASNTEPTLIVRIHPHNGRITSPVQSDDLRLNILVVYNTKNTPTRLQHRTVVLAAAHIIITKPKNRLRFLSYIILFLNNTHTDTHTR